jgi:manganese/iron transport system permease protein/iron/zinc/copper transport system permease protein
MMDWLLEPLRHEFNQRALLAALLIGFTNGYASAFVVLKKSALKVGSLSHALLPGIAVAILVAGLQDWSAFLGALFAALPPCPVWTSLCWRGCGRCPGRSSCWRRARPAR